MAEWSRGPRVTSRAECRKQRIGHAICAAPIGRGEEKITNNRKMLSDLLPWQHHLATRSVWRRCHGYGIFSLMDSLAAVAAPMPIGERIAALLKEQDKSAAWLADTAGMHRSTVHRLLTNKRKSPTPQTLAELAPVFGMTVEQRY